MKKSASDGLWWSTLRSRNSGCQLFELLCPDSNKSLRRTTFPVDADEAYWQSNREACTSSQDQPFLQPKFVPELEAVYLPPAAEGDVYRAALKRPQAIGIIDGYFQSIPDGTPQRNPMGNESWNPCIRQRQYRSPACGRTCCIWHGGRGKNF